MESKPGTYENVPFEDYLKIPAINQSLLKLPTPAHWKWQMDHPDKDESESAAMRLGSLTHCCILEPDEVENRYGFTGEGCDDWRLKAGKDAKAAIESLGRECVHKADWVAAHEMAARLLAHQDFGQWIQQPHLNELTVVWTDPQTGILCKARYDMLIDLTETCVIADFKTTQCAEPRTFARRDCADRGYYRQAAWYEWGAHCAGLKPALYVPIALEKSAPYLCGIYSFSEQARQLGQAENDRDLSIMERCQASGIWPGYPSELHDIDLPAWKYQKYQEEKHECAV